MVKDLHFREGFKYRDEFLRVALLSISVVACCLLPATLVAAPAIGYVQSSYATPQSSQTAVIVTYPAAQVAGDLNVVVVGWNDGVATVNAVTDAAGNVYALAVGPTVVTGVESQSIYYARNIAAAAAGANSVTVTFSRAAVNPDIRILEYSGADLVNPVDVTAAGSGNSAASSSGTVATTNSTDLLFGANFVQTLTIGPGSGYTSRMVTVPDGDIAEDEVVTAIGTYSAAAALNSSGAWIMQMVAFRAQSGGVAPPTVSGVSPNSGPVAGGTAVTITGTNFAAGAAVTFGGAAATSVVVVNSTTIAAVTPAGSGGAATVTVTAGGQSGSLTSGFTYVAVPPAPTVSGISPNSGPVAGGTAVTITGTNFAAGAAVMFGGTAATSVVVVNSTTITAATPAGSSGARTVTVTAGGQSGSLANGFTYTTGTAPAIGYVQSSYATPQSSQTAVTVTYPAAQVAGDLNVVVVGWNDGVATVNAVTDAAGNVYALAVGPTVVTGVESQSIYYARNIAAAAAGANSVTVTFSRAAVNPDIRILEYSGADLVNPVDVTAAGSGNSAASSSGTVATTNPTDLLFGANFVQTLTIGPGSGYTSRMVTVPDGDIAEDEVVTTTGTYSAAATLNSSGAWIMQMVAFRAQSGGVAPPTVSGVSPNSGPVAGGTVVTITGTNFAAGAAVMFGGAAATSVVVVNTTTIAAATPAGSGGAATVTVTASGQSGSLANGFTYVAVPPVPTVSGISPNSGPVAGGTAVTITGTNFAAGAAVMFGGTAATSVVVVNSTTIAAATPAGSGGAATVTVTAGGQSGSLINGFTYVAPPTVSGLSPNSGPVAGGTAVTITGTNFAAGAAVMFGGTAATSVVVVNSTTIAAATPAESSGATTVTVTAGGQSGSLINGFTYLVIPTVSGISPNSGPVAGGTAVTITGTNFAAGAAVMFGGTAATSVVVVNSTTITAATPAGSSGARTVTVTAGGQSGSLANGFTYTTGTAPAIGYVQSSYATPQSSQTAVTVAYPAAQVAGDLNVVVVGWNDGVATVNAVTDAAGNVYALAVGPTVVTGVESQSIYYARNVAAATAGANSVTVTFSRAAVNPDIRILEYSGADLVNPVDVTAAGSGNSAASSSGTVATTNSTDLLFGANFVQTLTIGPGSGYTSRMVTVPDGDIAEDEVVTTTGTYGAAATLNSSGAWIMQMVAFRAQSGGVALPTVSGVSPNSGPVAGGTVVTITGTNFAAGAAVMFGGTAATSIAVVNTTTIAAATPAGSGGAATVTVTASGQSGSLANGFTYVAVPPVPTVSGISPNSGPVAGGTAVTITGTNFAAGAAVMFGGTAATSVVVVNSTTIAAATPAGSGGAATVTVTVTAGGQSGSLINGFTYVAPPTVSGLSPNSGPVAGGTVVTITGTNFAAGAAVMFGGTAATSVVVVNSTTIAAATPAGSGGAATVTVTNPGGQSGSLANGFTYTTGTASAIGYVQSSYATPQSSQTAVTVTYPAAQVAGDLNVVVVGWNDGVATVNAVTDAAGNVYALAVGPTVVTGVESQSIYYARNIAAAAAGANSVTVTFSRAAVNPDIRILEYSGADLVNPVDVTAAGSGNSAASSSGTAATTNATDLLFGANLVQTLTIGPGSGYTSRMVTVPDGDIAEDEVVTTTGTYSAAAALNSSGAWIMQMVAFRAQSGGVAPPTAPSNLAATAVGPSQINLSWTGSTSNVGLANYIVQRCQGTGCTNFAQIATPSGTNYNDTGLLLSISYSYRVQAVDIAGNLSALSNTATAATQTLQAPTAPGNLTATAVSASQISLSWTASNSDVGLANYIVQRCQGAGCTNFAQIGTPAGTNYNDTGLLLSTSYGYRVQAVDTSGNLSAYSNVAIASTGSLLPLKTSSNNRYLVDQNGTPFLIMGDSPQSLVGNLSSSEMNTYMADRTRLGFNSLWVNLLCATYTACNSDGTTYDGVAPFTSGSSPSDYDLSTPNSAYFSRVDSTVNMAATYKLVVFLDPIETGSWLVTLENNGSSRAFNYGVYIGNRYKNFANIVWLHGNDFQTWSTNTTDNNLVKQVMAGIASVDSNHLQTIELNYSSSYSNQDTALGPLLTLDSAYSYFETYDIVLQAYLSSPATPTYLIEANYEYENDTGALPGPTGTYVLREQAYWTMLSGGAGQIYGNQYTWTFVPGWQSNLDSPGALEIQYINQLFGGVAWWNLVPDTKHQVVTAGYGTYDGSNQDLTAATYCTTSWITSGNLALTYCPNTSTLTVDLSKFSGPVTAQWYDPSNGAYTAVPGSPFLNSGVQFFTTPGINHDGDPDWVLVLKM